MAKGKIYSVRHFAKEPSLERPVNVGRNKLAQFRQPYGKRSAAMPELRKLVPAYGPSGIVSPFFHAGSILKIDSSLHVRIQTEASVPYYVDSASLFSRCCVKSANMAPVGSSQTENFPMFGRAVGATQIFAPSSLARAWLASMSSTAT